jgi:hypothetical protein
VLILLDTGHKQDFTVLSLENYKYLFGPDWINLTGNKVGKKCEETVSLKKKSQQMRERAVDALTTTFVIRAYFPWWTELDRFRSLPVIL